MFHAPIRMRCTNRLDDSLAVLHGRKPNNHLARDSGIHDGMVVDHGRNFGLKNSYVSHFALPNFQNENTPLWFERTETHRHKSLERSIENKRSSLKSIALDNQGTNDGGIARMLRRRIGSHGQDTASFTRARAWPNLERRRIGRRAVSNTGQMTLNFSIGVRSGSRFFRYAMRLRSSESDVSANRRSGIAGLGRLFSSSWSEAGCGGGEPMIDGAMTTFRIGASHKGIRQTARNQLVSFIDIPVRTMAGSGILEEFRQGIVRSMNSEAGLDRCSNRGLALGVETGLLGRENSILGIRSAILRLNALGGPRTAGEDKRSLLGSHNSRMSDLAGGLVRGCYGVTD